MNIFSELEFSLMRVILGKSRSLVNSLQNFFLKTREN